MKKLLSIILSLCMLIPSLMIIGMASGTFSNQEGNLLYNPQLDFTYNGSTYTVDGWSLPSIATVTEGADGYNVVTIATSDTNNPYALRSTKSLDLDADKYYKFSIMYKLEDPPSGDFNINNKVFFAYKYNNTYVNRGNLSKNASWTEASFIMYGGDVTANAWDKFFAVVSNYSRCTLSVKMPSVTVYDPDTLDYKQDVVAENFIENGDLSVYDESSNTFDNFVIDSMTSPWYDSHSRDTVQLNDTRMNALRLTVNKENNNRYAKMFIDGNSISKTGVYKFSLWIKLENNSATGNFNNNSSVGKVKLYFHHGTTNDVSTAFVQTKEEWQKLEFVIDESVHKNATWWDLNQFAVGIQVYSLECDILLADLKLEPVSITVSAQSAQNGTLEINRTTASKGDSLQVLAKADSGYKLKRLYYTDGETETDITTKKQTVAVSNTQGGHNATVYESVASDLIYSCTLSEIADYTVIAVFVDENESEDDSGSGGQTPPTEEAPSQIPNENTYLSNYDFEAYLSGKAVSWNEGNFSNATQTYSTTAHGGDYALLIESTSRNGVPFIAQSIKAIDSTKLYKIGVYVKTVGEMDRSYDGGGIKVRISYTLNGETVKVSSSGYKTVEEWTEISTLFQIPQDAEDIKAIVILDCIAGSVLIDDMSITEVGDALQAEDGSFVNGGFETYFENEFIGWSFYNGGNDKNSATQDTGRTGKAAVLRDTNTDHIMNLSQSVTLDKAKKYLISVYVKTTYDDNTSFYVPSWGGAYLEYSAGDYTVTSELITTTAPYKKVSIVVDGSKIPDNTTGTVKFVMKYMRGIIYLDDATITEYTGETVPDDDNSDESVSTEKLYNLSFEEGEGDVFEYWTKNTGSNIKLVSSDAAYDGKRAVKAVSTNRNAVASISQAINNLDSSKRYLLSAWAKQLTELDFAYTGAGVKLSVTYTLEGSQVTAGTVTLKEMSDWSQLKLYFQVPENAEKVTAKLTFDCFKGEVLADNVTISEIGNAVEKADGQFANGGFEEYYDGQFAEWSFYNGGNDKNSATQDTGRTGKAAVLRDTNTDHIMSFSQNVVLDRSKTYKISLFVRATSDDDTSFYVPSWGGAYLQLEAGNYKVISEMISSTCRYRQLSIIVDGSKLPEGTVPKISFVMKYMRGIIYLDDAKIEVYDGTQKDEVIVYEDLYNLSFEEGKNNSFDDWNKNTGPDVEILATTSVHHDGNRAVRIVSTNRNAVAKLYQNINNVDSTKRYRITVWAKTADEVDVAYDGGGIKLQVTYKDANGKTQSSSSAARRTLDEWTQLYVDYQIPVGATDVRVNLLSDCLAGEVYFDDMSISVIGKAVVMPEQDPLNLAPNFSFENGQGGSFPGWYWWTNNSKNTCEVGEAHFGAQSAKVTSNVADSSAQLSWDTTSIENSGWYQFSVWVKTENVVALSAGNGGVSISIQFKKPDSNTSLKVYRSEYLVGTNGWTQLIVRGKFPEGCKRVVFALSLSQSTGTVYWDDVDIRKIEYTDSNMLKNGSFDEIDTDGNLLYWEKETDDWSFASFQHENNTAMVSNAGICSSYYYQEVEGLTYGEEYVLSGNISADSIVTENGGAAVMLEMIDVYGNVVERMLCNEYISGTSESILSFNAKFTLSENCKKVRVLLACDKAAGTALFSDLRMASLNDYSGDEAVEATTLKLMSDFAENSVTPIISEKGFNLIPIIIVVSVVAVLAAASVIAVVVIKKRKTK